MSCVIGVLVVVLAFWLFELDGIDSALRALSTKGTAEK